MRMIDSVELSMKKSYITSGKGNFKEQGTQKIKSAIWVLNLVSLLMRIKASFLRYVNTISCTTTELYF